MAYASPLRGNLKPDRQIQIGLLGLGTVGSQVYQALAQNFESLLEKTGFSIHVKKILVRDSEKKRKFDLQKNLLTSNPDEILENPDLQIVVEMLGGVEPAASHISRALINGKSVVTANKAVIATHGEKLLSLAAKSNVDLFFEASVAGAIPILRPLQESLATDRILEIVGILNGTTNYILTQMTQGKPYEDALKQAQKFGYAEPDPAFDVTGMDAAYKIAILAFLAFGIFTKGEQISRQGIDRIVPDEIRHASELGYRIKLLAIARSDGKQVSLSVSPTLVPAHHPLCNVEGSYNAILVKGERFGDIMFYGQGAGGVPTSTAIVSDLVQASRNLALGTGGKSIRKIDNQAVLASPESLRSRFYLRLHVEDKPGTLASLAQIFAEESVSFSAVIQKENTASATDIIFLTHTASASALNRALAKIQKLPLVKNIRSILHVL